MKTLVAGLLALTLAVFLALEVRNDNGYVLLGYGEWTVEGSLAFFLFANLLLFLLLYLALRLLARVWSVPRQVHGWQDRRAQRRARKELTQGLLELSEGDWKGAEKKLVRHVDRSEAPLLNYLAAARSAQQQGADDRRDHYLELAHDSMPSASVAVGLTRAELQLAHAQLDQAKQTLQQLRQIAPRHSQVLKLRAEVYERSADWDGLNKLLPELRKSKVVAEGELQTLELRVFGKLLENAALQTILARWTGHGRRFPSPLATERNWLSCTPICCRSELRKGRPKHYCVARCHGTGATAWLSFTVGYRQRMARGSCRRRRRGCKISPAIQCCYLPADGCV